MRHDLIHIINPYISQLSKLHVSIVDVIRIALDSYAQFQRNHLIRSQSSIDTSKENYMPSIWMGIDSAIRNYNPNRGTKFTTYLHDQIRFKLLDNFNKQIEEEKSNRIELQSYSLPSPYQNTIERLLDRNDTMDEFGKYLWMRNEPQLFMLLPLITLGYSNREMARFMMRDEKTIRNWMKRIYSLTLDFNNSKHTGETK